VVPKEKLSNYTGWYRNPRSGGPARLFLQNEKLYATQFGLLVPVAENIFTAANGAVRIETNSKGFLFIGSEKDSIYFTAVDPAKLDEKAVNEYTGEYYSEEAEARFYISVKNGKLVMLQKPKTEFQLTPTYKDGFESPAGVVYFEREKGKITHLKISVTRARNIEFRKVNN
jgi:hypothetical protein